MTFNHESTGPTAQAPSAGAIRAKRQSVPGPIYEEEVVLLDVDFLDPFFAFFQQDIDEIIAYFEKQQHDEYNDYYYDDYNQTMNDTDTWDWRTTAFYVCKNFYYYKSGVYTTDCDPNNPDYEGGHAVTIVGYGTSSQGVPYWLVRNSWGTNWGMQGYFWMKRGTDPSSFESWGNTDPHTHAM
ncbi:unnamed protein product, partial [Mesorhabditis spiculigera]